MGTKQERARRIQSLVAEMNGLVLTRNLFLFSQKERVTWAMIAAIELSSRPPNGPGLPDVINSVACAIMHDTEIACDLACLSDMQCETLMDVTRRGIEAFAKACGMAKIEEIRAGRLDSNWEALIERTEAILREVLRVESTGHPLELSQI